MTHTRSIRLHIFPCQGGTMVQWVGVEMTAFAFTRYGGGYYPFFKPDAEWASKAAEAGARHYGSPVEVVWASPNERVQCITCACWHELPRCFGTMVDEALPGTFTSSGAIRYASKDDQSIPMWTAAVLFCVWLFSLSEEQ